MGKRIIHKKTILLLLPILLLYGVFIGGGLLGVLFESLGYIPSLGLNNLTLEHYLDIFLDRRFIESLFFSLYIALASALISTILGVLIAYRLMITTNRLWRYMTDRVLQIGLILPYLYVVFLTMLFLGKTGFISRIFLNFSWISSLEDFPRFVFDPYGFGIILVYVLKGTPFIALFVLNIMSSISTTYHQVATTLGATESDILRKIYLPLAANTISWTSAILFTYDLGAFEVPYLLGTNKAVTLSSWLYSLYLNPHISEIPASMAMNILLLTIGALSVMIYRWVIKSILMGGR
ncbi:ABC transporter permease [Petrocella sp. FN5]|uniref:ABC transporter permease n=1 Tax=Petrocella sp. FN5 TaxID=3032002 RepID=UPI0023DB5E53|nr:ABC transporter permease subunit [Petrocella sp. FN5]MDF1617605.1 ABC transporter permease subunit [Petrocella sp. FN5]